jgi:acetylornithine aminotransferase
VAAAIFDVIEGESLLHKAAALGEHAVARLRKEPAIQGKVREVRGRGLMLGIELQQPPTKFVERGLANGIVANLTAQKVIRLAPALTISPQQWDRGLEALIRTIAEG